MSGLVTALNTKISEVRNKILNTSDLVTTTVLNTKISEAENKIPSHDKYIAVHGCAHYIFASLFFKSKQKHLSN